MHARELVELAAIVSAHGPALIRGGKSIPAQKHRTVLDHLQGSAGPLGAAAKDGLVDVADDADDARRDARISGPRFAACWKRFSPAKCSRGCGRPCSVPTIGRRGTDEAEPVARSVLIGHIEARHRVLTLMARTPGIDAEAAVKLNRLRRRAERWTDLLVGHLADMHGVSEFAFDPQRARDFAEDWRSSKRFTGQSARLAVGVGLVAGGIPARCSARRAPTPN